MKLAWDSQYRTEKSEGYVRQRSDAPYHTARWTKLSRQWRTAHPLCAECQRNGIVTPGQVTDHIVPWPVCKDFYDMNNLQTLCEKCNHAKGQRDKKLIQKSRNNG